MSLCYRIKFEGVKIKLFKQIELNQIIKEDDLFLVVYDKYPVSLGHILVFVKRPIIRFLELTIQEKTALMEWIDWTVHYLEENLEPKPDGFNIGINDGEAAGQSIKQLHFHIIPRYRGDVPDPRGGIRFVIPEKAIYWEK